MNKMLLAAAAASLTCVTSEAQSFGIDYVYVQRLQFERQLDESTRVPDTDYPWGIDVAVELDSGAPPLSPEPTVSGPISLQEPYFNGGVLGYNPEEEWHNIGAGGHGCGTTTEAEIDSLFGNGTYDFRVAGSSVFRPAEREPCRRAAADAAGRIGGGWHDGKYYFVGTSPHTITVSPFAEFAQCRRRHSYLEGCGSISMRNPSPQGGSVRSSSTSMRPKWRWYGLPPGLSRAPPTSSLFPAPLRSPYRPRAWCSRSSSRAPPSLSRRWRGRTGRDGYPFTGGNNLAHSASGRRCLLLLPREFVPGFIPNPGGSQGNLCLSGNIGRIQRQRRVRRGRMRLDQPRDQHPESPQPGGNVAIQPGETWNFQAWYRDQPSPPSTASRSPSSERRTPPPELRREKRARGERPPLGAAASFEEDRPGSPGALRTREPGFEKPVPVAPVRRPAGRRASLAATVGDVDSPLGTPPGTRSGPAPSRIGVPS